MGLSPQYSPDFHILWAITVLCLTRVLRHSGSFNLLQQFKICLRVCHFCVPCFLLLFLASACYHKFCPEECFIISLSVSLLATDSFSFNFKQKQLFLDICDGKVPSHGVEIWVGSLHLFPHPLPELYRCHSVVFGLLRLCRQVCVSCHLFSMSSLSFSVYFHNFVFGY